MTLCGSHIIVHVPGKLPTPKRERERERERIRKNICNRPSSLFHIEHPAAANAK
jgi:hypothetical protein